ncbi:hypothetical protein, partial [Parendozoicomonas sp. Alg238-R29]|uniref:hypothetical protein n=1 Tax=Parendozoicomonas sp. Alg238-R29 TaxID=2993446 RepID=UPI00248D5E64
MNSPIRSKLALLRRICSGHVLSLFLCSSVMFFVPTSNAGIWDALNAAARVANKMLDGDSEDPNKSETPPETGNTEEHRKYMGMSDDEIERIKENFKNNQKKQQENDEAIVTPPPLEADKPHYLDWDPEKVKEDYRKAHGLGPQDNGQQKEEGDSYVDWDPDAIKEQFKGAQKTNSNNEYQETEHARLLKADQKLWAAMKDEARRELKKQEEQDA